MLTVSRYLEINLNCLLLSYGEAINITVRNTTADRGITRDNHIVDFTTKTEKQRKWRVETKPEW